MDEDTDDLDDLDTGARMAHIFGEGPDYQEWPPAGKYSPLRKAMCYVDKLHLDPIERPDTASESAKLETYTAHLDLAISDILDKKLITKKSNDEDWVEVEDFYRWVRENVEDPPREFLARDPSLNKSKENAKDRDKRIYDAACEIAASRRDEGQSWKKKDIAYEIYKKRIFPNIDQGTIERGFILKEVRLSLDFENPHEKN